MRRKLKFISAKSIKFFVVEATIEIILSISGFYFFILFINNPTSCRRKKLTVSYMTLTLLHGSVRVAIVQNLRNSVTQHETLNQTIGRTALMVEI